MGDSILWLFVNVFSCFFMSFLFDDFDLCCLVLDEDVGDSSGLFLCCFCMFGYGGGFWMFLEFVVLIMCFSFGGSMPFSKACGCNSTESCRVWFGCYF